MVFKYLEYKKFLEHKIKENHKIHGYKSRLAAAAGCQLSFLSQVLRGSVHLTPDHALRLALHWKLPPLERDYFIELVNFARAGGPELRAHLKERLQRIKLDSENLQKRFAGSSLEGGEAAAIYYASWHHGAIHILLTIPEYRTVPAIAERLRLPEPLVTAVLEALARLGLARTSADGRWEATRHVLHLSGDSPWNAVNHHHWRQLAVENAFAARAGDLHYTAVYSLSLADVERLKQLLLQFIDESRRIVGPSREEDLICFNCDLFRVGHVGVR